MWSRAPQAGVAGALLLLSACAQPGAPPVCTAPLKPALEVSLYFGRDKPAGGQVSDAEWASFVTEIVTPQFPAGHSIVDAGGQYRDSSGRIVRESSKLIVIVVFDAPTHRPKVTSIVDTYVKRFGQESVLRVERPVCAGL
jgi:hypothetical protein